MAAGEPPFLYLTTTGRRTGRPRQIEIWFVGTGGRYYVLAERGRRAGWVRNILQEPRVTVRIGSREAPEVAARARVLDPVADADAWTAARRLAETKYGWGDGLPVEITPQR
ncbi:MAG: nitroreductase family deazaflavin-dependent oxidoreductase [Armatimonadota bacterium]|nr:nitroreductase family deazaflavin-dependent oxidoreductase [Armatimonadota bacterium]